jgi:hypothetical protein
MPQHRVPDIQRVLEKVVKNPETGCWVYGGYLNDAGYGITVISGTRRRVRVHRVAYEHFKGPIPEGFHVDHLCFNPRCVNPAHLEAVTNGENVRRSIRAGKSAVHGWAMQRDKTHCQRGHPYDEANTYRTPDNSKRHCRACGRLNAARYRQARLAAERKAA